MDTINTSEAFEKIVGDLVRTGAVEQAAIVSRDGLQLFSTMKNSESLVALASTLVGSAEHVFAELNKGSIERVIAENIRCKIVAMGAGKKALLLTIAKPDVSLGLILIEAEKAALKIEQIY